MHVFVQVELFCGSEIVDDGLSLVDVAYIYIMKKVRTHLVLNSRFINCHAVCHPVCHGVGGDLDE